MTAWWTFLRERFPPASYGPLIALVVAAHVAVLSPAPLQALSSSTALLLLIATLAFLLRLRLWDELKDLDDDRVHRPHLPVPRGLVTARGVERAGLVCAVVELSAFAALGAPALVGGSLLFAYTLLMRREFFARAWLRPRLLLYATLHTASSALLTLAIGAALTREWPWSLPPGAYALALASFGCFTLFEVARKTWASAEERRGVASYSRAHGRGGAALLVVTLGACSSGVALLAGVPAMQGVAVFVATAVLLVVGLAYARADAPHLAAGFRSTASIWLLVFYVALSSTLLEVL